MGQAVQIVVPNGPARDIRLAPFETVELALARLVHTSKEGARLLGSGLP